MLTLLITGSVSVAAFGLMAGAFALAQARGRALPIGCGAATAYARAHDLLVEDGGCGCGCGECGDAEIVELRPAPRTPEVPARRAA